MSDPGIYLYDDNGDPIKKVANGYLRKCMECGELFVARTLKTQFCSKEHYRPCPVCGKLVLAKYLADPPRCCSQKCSRELAKKTNIEKYGVADSGNSNQAKEKRKQTNLKKYGVENPFQAQEFKEKSKKTNLEKYGVEYASQNEAVQKQAIESFNRTFSQHKDEINAKRIQTNLEKYGTENPHQNKDVLDKTKKTNLERYGVECTIWDSEIHKKVIETNVEKFGTENPAASSEVRKRITETCEKRYGGTGWRSKELLAKSQDTMFIRYGVRNAAQSSDLVEKRKQTCLDRYGVPAAFLTSENKEKCRQGMLENRSKHISKINIAFSELLKNEGINVEFEWYVGGKYYDLCIVDSNILIEINPTYTHCSQPNFYYKDGMNPQYHLEKSKIARENGYRCIHIFDWDNNEKILNMLKPVNQRIFARKCEIQKIPTKIANAFLNEYHLQGTVRKQKLSLGLFYNDELMSVMTFGTARYSSKAEWELLRFATKTRTIVSGGASKLFHYFIDITQPQSVISYCDLSKFTGSVYEQIGMHLDHVSSPAKVWSKDDKYITDNLLRARGYDQIFDTHYGKGTSNEQLMIDNGWRSVYDCGQKVFIWRR